MLQAMLGLATAWIMLIPALLVLWLRIGGAYHPLMAPFLGIAASVPMLGFLTLGAFALMAVSVRRLSRGSDS